MARTPTTPPAIPETSREDDVLIREIDEAVREDAVYDFMRNHGVKVLGVVLLGLAGLGGYMIWDHYAERGLEQQSETLVGALDYADQGDFKTAAEKVAPLLGDDNTSGARTAARFVQASAAIEAGDNAKASGIYKQIVADADAPPALRDLARIRDVTINYDRMKPADVIAQLGPLAKAGNPYLGSAGELVAMAHLEAGNRMQAGKVFAAIAADESQPESLRSRARQMAGLMGVDAVVDVDKLLKEQGVTDEPAPAAASATNAGGNAAPVAAQ